MVKWHIALMSAESTQGDGGLAVDGGTYPPYAPVSTITAPTSSPTSGDLYGANGYQLGIDVGSDNVYMFGGTDVPVENEDSRVRLAHTDFSTAVFGQDFYGYVTPGYGAQVIRMTDIPFDATQIEGSLAQFDVQGGCDSEEMMQSHDKLCSRCVVLTDGCKQHDFTCIAK